MKISLSLFVAIALQSSSTANAAIAGCTPTFSVDVDASDECDIDALIEAVTAAAVCTNAEAAVIEAVGATDRAGAEANLDALCNAAMTAQATTDFTTAIPDTQAEGDEAKKAYIKNYFNGKTDWNEQVATLYPRFDPSKNNNRNRNHMYLLARDAARVDELYEAEGQTGKLEYPTDRSYINNFLGKGGTGECAWNTAYCCWPKDRQAGDNNGNCQKQYDVDCVDKNPADNADLCFIDTDESKDITGVTSSATMIFPDDDGNNIGNFQAEGAIHCHGLAWEDNVNDLSYQYRGNNLFYVSMYDHMYQRGYVRNFPGAPMCACAEHMPTVSRSDCTELSMTLDYTFVYDGASASIDITATDLDFNACQGKDRYGDDDDNDLWSYVHRLYLEEKIADGEKLVGLSTKLVGDDPNACDGAIKKQLAGAIGVERGYNSPNSWQIFAGRESVSAAHGYGRHGFAKRLQATPNKIIRRICPNCDHSHKDIYYKYKGATVSTDYHVLDDLMYIRRNAADHVYGTDFEIYSTYDDAINDVNPWACTNYLANQGFPGDCGPDGGRARNQESRFERFKNTQTDVAFYLEKASTSPFTELNSLLEVGDTKMASGMVFEEAGKYYMSGVGMFNGGTEESLDFWTQERWTQDFVVSVDVESFDAHHKFCRAGIMLRENAEKDSPFLAIWVTGNGKVGVAVRETQGAEAQWRERGGVVAETDVPSLRIVRTGSVYTAEYKASATAEWATVVRNPATFDVNRPRIGLFVSSFSEKRVAQAVFTNYNLVDSTASA